MLHTTVAGTYDVVAACTALEDVASGAHRQSIGAVPRAWSEHMLRHGYKLLLEVEQTTVTEDGLNVAELVQTVCCALWVSQDSATTG